MSDVGLLNDQNNIYKYRRGLVWLGGWPQSINYSRSNLVASSRLGEPPGMNPRPTYTSVP